MSDVFEDCKDCVDDVPADAILNVSADVQMPLNDAVGELQTETPGGRIPKAALEGGPQDGAGIRGPPSPVGLPSSSSTGGGLSFQELQKAVLDRMGELEELGDARIERYLEVTHGRVRTAFLHRALKEANSDIAAAVEALLRIGPL